MKRPDGLASCWKPAYFGIPISNPIIMKKRISRVLNFLAFNLLFFALYLNFIHKDSNAQATAGTKPSTPTAKGTVLVKNPDQFIKQNNHTLATAQHN
jgi:hypothetical protein